jgi:NAD(P)-dependent dehydrogenase (short-subunit alcohol dehydrogenase family)
MKLADRVAVVTGSGSGAGEALARRFAAEGAKVIVTDIDGRAVERVAREIGGLAVPGDMTVEGDVHRVIASAREVYGDVDVWFSNAGYSGPPQPGVVPPDAAWDRAWSLHVMAHVYAARALLPSMVARGDGYLLQTASEVALSTHHDKVAYAVTKHAALALSEWLAVQFRRHGVKVSCFCPGPMMTPMLRSNEWPDDHPAMIAAMPTDVIADIVTRGIEAERFLIVARPERLGELQAKGRDYEEWINDAGGRLP